MAWNEPGGNGRDPWGGGNNKNDGPPDLDEALQQLNKKIKGLFGGNNSGNSSGSGALIGLVLFVLAALWAFTGFYQVNEQERGVVLRLGVYNDVVGPGLHWNPPLIDSVEIQNVTSIRTHKTNGRMLTKDLNLVELNLTVQYNISDIKNFALVVQNPENSLREATDSALRHVIGTTDMDAVLTDGRAAIATEAKARLQEMMDKYQTGIQITKVTIEQSRPPQEVSDAFNDVSRAKEDQDRLKQEAEAYALGIVPIARGQAQRVSESAQAYRERVVAEAEGDAARFSSLLIEYQRSPEVTRERMYIDMMQQVLGATSKVILDVEGGNNMMYLPLDKIVNQGGAGHVAPTSSLKDAQRTLESLRSKVQNTGTNVREVRR